jgi:hypothetical protein
VRGWRWLPRPRPRRRSSIRRRKRSRASASLRAPRTPRTTPAAGTITSVTDTAGNTYTQCGATYNPHSDNKYAWYYAKVTTGNASNQVSAALSSATGNAAVSVLHYSGMTAASPCDTTDSGSGTSAQADTGSFTTASNDELIHAVVDLGTADASVTAGTGYTMGHNLVANFIHDEYDSNGLNTAGANSATLDLSASRVWYIFAVAYKSADSGAATTRSLGLLGVGQ